MLTWQGSGGFSVNTSVRIEAEDRAGIERLVRGPPQSDLLTGRLDQTPAFDPAEPDPFPDFEFDQSLPDFSPWRVDGRRGSVVSVGMGRHLVVR